jgi:hypothetical protein
MPVFYILRILRADGQQQRDGHHQRNYHSDGGKHWGDAHRAEVTQLYLGFPEAAGEPPQRAAEGLCQN